MTRLISKCATVNYEFRAEVPVQTDSAENRWPLIFSLRSDIDPVWSLRARVGLRAWIEGCDLQPAFLFFFFSPDSAVMDGHDSVRCMLAPCFVFWGGFSGNPTS